jgi:hypothetical protein
VLKPVSLRTAEIRILFGVNLRRFGYCERPMHPDGNIFLLDLI